MYEVILPSKASRVYPLNLIKTALGSIAVRTEVMAYVE